MAEPVSKVRVAILVAVLALVGLCALGAVVDGDHYGPPPVTAADEVVTACQIYVHPLLKSPKSALFADNATATEDDEVWTVRGVVRATNSFGAEVPTTYHCLVARSDGKILVLSGSVD